LWFLGNIYDLNLKKRMKHFYSFLFLLLLTGPAFAQQSQTIYFGELKQKTQRYADVRIRNTAEYSVHIVRIEHSPEIVYRVDKDYINPDSSFTLRIQVNPDTTGSFDHVIRVFLSDSEIPVEMRVTGNVKAIPDYSDLLQQKCPEFAMPREERTTKPLQTEFTVTSIDAETKEVIMKSTVTIISNGEVTESWKTGTLGSIRKKAPPGFLYFVVGHEGYETTETGVYITPDIETVYIPLKRSIVYNPYKFQEPKDTVEIEPQLAHRISHDEFEKSLQNEIKRDSLLFADLPELKDIPADAFDTSLFKPVNVVFVLDISSSMKMGEKMNLLKYSLNQLTEQLRDQDRISFVTYAEGAQVYMKPTSGANRELIRSKIAALEADGMSSNTKGIKLGYKELSKQMADGEANMVIIITDGAFNKYSNDYQQIVQKYAEQQVIFSVVGIHCRTNDEQKMKEAAAYGNGRYIAINKLSDAQYKLLQEIRIAAYRGY
jgi:Ca-activated chloride channel homolog